MELCFLELKSFNDKKEFLGGHPFIRHKDERSRIEGLIKAHPEEFLKELKNVDLNITRYKSHLKRKGIKDDDKERTEANLARYIMLRSMYFELFKNTVGNHDISI